MIKYYNDENGLRIDLEKYEESVLQRDGFEIWEDEKGIKYIQITNLPLIKQYELKNIHKYLVSFEDSIKKQQNEFFDIEEL